MRIAENLGAGSENSCARELVSAKAKRALVGAGGRILFYPTLFYNVCRNKMEAEFRWWDEVDQMESKHMMPTSILEYIGSRRPRVLLAPSQWQAIQEYSKCKKEVSSSQDSRPTNSLTDDEILITTADLEYCDITSEDASNDPRP